MQSTTDGDPVISLNWHIDEADLQHILEFAEEDLRALEGACLLITGGTGFLGRWLLEALLYANTRMALGLELTVLSRNPELFKAQLPMLAENPVLSFIQGDVRTFSFPRHKGLSHIIHGATGVAVTPSPMEEFSVITEGTRRILECCPRASNTDILFLSSGAVYGLTSSAVAPILEESATDLWLQQTHSGYGIGKACAEWLGAAHAAMQGTPFKIARIFATVGAHLPLDKHFAAGNFIANALRGEAVIVTSDGCAQRSFLYAADTIVWLLAVLIRGTPARAYNIGSDEAISIYQLATTIRRLSRNMESTVKVCGEAEPQASRKYYVPDIRRAQKELGLAVTIPLQEALRRTMAWWQNRYH